MKKMIFVFIASACLVFATPLSARSKKQKNEDDPKYANAAALIAAYYLYLVNDIHKEPTDCQQKDDIYYCYYEGDPGTETVVYALHGFANDQNFWGWNSVTKNIIDYWKNNNIAQPHIVSMTFKNFWTYSPNYGEKLDDFVEKMESQLELKDLQKRHLYGDSMGGFNSLRWFAESQIPFNGLSVICPALPFSLIPEDVASDYKAYKSFFGFQAEILFGKDSPSGKYFDFDLITEKMKSLDFETFTMVSVNPDYFGFYEGNQVLASKISEVLPMDHFHFETQKVRHCDVNSDELARRLAFENKTKAFISF